MGLTTLLIGLNGPEKALCKCNKSENDDVNFAAVRTADAKLLTSFPLLLHGHKVVFNGLNAVLCILHRPSGEIRTEQDTTG